PRRPHHGSPTGPLPAQRRAALAQAMLKNPDLLILDEPFAGFDPIGCGELKEFVLTLARRGKTVIISSDSLTNLKDICSRIAVLYGGLLEAVGTIEELLARPGAVRFLAPAISAPALEGLLQIIRQDLTSGKRPVGLPLENSLVSELPAGIPDPITDSIDHKRLAGLSQPSAANTSRPPEKTNRPRD